MGDLKKMLGARIKELRRSRGLSQDDLSGKVGVDSKYISRIEVGGCWPSLDRLNRIADALGVKLYELFIFDHHDPEATSQEELESILSSASPDERKLIYKIIKAVHQ